MTKREKAKIMKRIEQAKAVIAEKRDELRDILSELNSICDTCDEAEESLDAAIYSISQYL